MRSLVLSLIISALVVHVATVKRGGCRYKPGEWSECTDGAVSRTRTLTLKGNKQEGCDESLTETKTCRKWKKTLKGNGCIYHHGEWSQCDRGVRTKTLTLMSGDPQICQSTLTITAKCKAEGRAGGPPAGCKYSKAAFSECDPATRNKTRTRFLIKGDITNCPNPYQESKKCRVKGQGKCRYNPSKFGACDPTTNTRLQIRTLKEGSPEGCNATMTKIKECKPKTTGRSGPMCRYEAGEWSTCTNETTHTTRIDTLTDGSDPVCPKTRLRRKACSGCKYRPSGAWSECVDGKRTRELYLVSGDPALGECERTKTQEKSCGGKGKGNGKCIYGDWTRGSCVDGVREMTRDVLSGGDRCQRTTKQKKC